MASLTQWTPGESGLVSRGSKGLHSPLESDGYVLEPTEWLKGSQTSSGVWREDTGLLSRECMKCSLALSNFHEEISSLSHSIVFLCFFALITEEGLLSLLAIL